MNKTPTLVALALCAGLSTSALARDVAAERAAVDSQYKKPAYRMSFLQLATEKAPSVLMGEAAAPVELTLVADLSSKPSCLAMLEYLPHVLAGELRLRLVPVALGDPLGLKMAGQLLASKTPVAYLQTLTCADKPAALPTGPAADTAGVVAATEAMFKEGLRGFPVAVYEGTKGSGYSVQEGLAPVRVATVDRFGNHNAPYKNDGYAITDASYKTLGLNVSRLSALTAEQYQALSQYANAGYGLRLDDRSKWVEHVGIGGEKWMGPAR